MFNGLRAVVGIIIFVFYFIFAFFFVKIVVGSVTLAIILQIIPISIILLDGGDRVIRYLVELKKQIVRARFNRAHSELKTEEFKKESGKESILIEEKGRVSKRTSFFSNLVKPRERYSDGLKTFLLKPYCIMASVYNIEGEWEQIWPGLSPWKDVLFIVDDASTDNTRSIIAKSGVNVISNPVNTNKPGALQFGLSRLPSEIETVMIIDPDVELPDKITLKRAIFDFQRSNAAACGLQILPLMNNHGFYELCQNMEYEDSMAFGKIVPHNYIFTSGGGALYKKQPLEDSLKLSSKSIYAEDLETSLIIVSDKLRTYFDDRVVIRTEVPTTIKKLTLQKMGWYFGLAKVTFSFIRKALSNKDLFLLYHFYIYNLIINIILHPLRVIAIFIYVISVIALVLEPWGSSVAQYQLIPTISIISITLFYLLLSLETFLWSPDLRRRDILAIFIFPIYKVYLNIVPITLAYINYILWKLFKVKLVNDHYEKSKAIF